MKVKKPSFCYIKLDGRGSVEIWLGEMKVTAGCLSEQKVRYSERSNEK